MNIPKGPHQRTVRELHDAAMNLSLRWMVAYHSGEGIDQTVAFAEAAMVLERSAAQLLAPVAAHEPTRAILYRSAAWLALHAFQRDEARRLADAGLAGVDVPMFEQEKLRAVLSAVDRQEALKQQLLHSMEAMDDRHQSDPR